MRFLIALSLYFATANAATVLERLECVRSTISDGAEQVRTNIQEAIGEEADAQALFGDLKNVSKTFKDNVKNALDDVRKIFEECQNAGLLIKRAFCRAKQYTSMSTAVTPMTAGVVADFTKTLVKHSIKVGKAMAKVTFEASKFPIYIFRALRRSLRCLSIN